MKNQRGCINCEYEATGKEAKCPQCGSWIRRNQRIHRLGFVLVALGILLVVMMAVITAATAPMLLSAGAETSGARFTGTPEQGLMILGLFGLIAVFGVTAIVAGVFQIATGRRSMWIIIAVLGLALILFVVAQALRGSLARSRVEGWPLAITESSVT